MTSFSALVYNGLKATVGALGYDLKVTKKKNNPPPAGLNLNVAAGSYIIPGFESLDIYTPHYYASKEAFEAERVEYDLRKDALPYNDDCVDNIYISHAIEHIEDFAVLKFFEESYRVLKKGGVLRIVCPDGRFLFNVSQFENGYWNWRKENLKNPTLYHEPGKTLTQYDYLLRELSTPRLPFYKFSRPELEVDAETLRPYSFEDLAQKLKDGMSFRAEHPGDHINIWDFERIQSTGLSAGFAHVIQSKFRGSVSAAMQGEIFDKSFPHMSIHVDLVK